MLNFIPAVTRVPQNQKTNMEDHLFWDVKEDQDYTIDLAIMNQDGNPNVRTEICACPDPPGSGSPNAPQKYISACGLAGANK